MGFGVCLWIEKRVLKAVPSPQSQEERLIGKLPHGFRELDTLVLAEEMVAEFEMRILNEVIELS